MTVAEWPITVNSKQRKALLDFLRLTEYTASDILSLSYETNTFLTRNGGKYCLKGNKIIHLSGPSADSDDRL